MITGAVLLDLDDTLYPEWQFVFGGYRAVSDLLRAERGLEVYDELVEQFRAGRHQGVFARVLARHGPQATEPELQRLVHVYRAHQPNLLLFPDVMPFLDVLRARGIPLGLVTDGPPEVQRRKIAVLGLGPCFDAVVCSDALGLTLRKPHPRPFEECLRRLGRTAVQSVFIGDNPQKDFIAPKALGMLTIRIRRPGTLHAAARLAAPEEAAVEVGDLTEALGWTLERVSPEAGWGDLVRDETVRDAR